VSRVNRRVCIRTFKFDRSANDVLTYLGSALPSTGCFPRYVGSFAETSTNFALRCCLDSADDNQALAGASLIWPATEHLVQPKPSEFLLDIRFGGLCCGDVGVSAGEIALLQFGEASAVQRTC
jgi:hypothetical protein